MRSFVVVNPDPIIGKALHFSRGVKEMGIKNVFAKRFVDAFNAAVFTRFTFLNENQFHAIG